MTTTETPPDQHLLTERDGHTLIVTMNRPERRNALSPSMMQKLSEAWDEVNANPDIRVAILTGNGGTFCAGMDLGAATAAPPGDAFEKGDDAVAGGTEILQATDIRVAGESARFGVSEVRWSLFPLGGSTVRLRRQVPYTIAADILLTGRHLRAPEAKEIGLIGHVVPDGTAVDKAMELAEVVAENAPLSVQAVLRSLRESGEMTEAEGLANELTLGWPIFATEDAKEGATAFKEKRKANFKGK